MSFVRFAVTGSNANLISYKPDIQARMCIYIVYRPIAMYLYELLSVLSFPINNFIINIKSMLPDTIFSRSIVAR